MKGIPLYVKRMKTAVKTITDGKDELGVRPARATFARRRARENVKTRGRFRHAAPRKKCARLGFLLRGIL